LASFSPSASSNACDEAGLHAVVRSGELRAARKLHHGEPPFCLRRSATMP
jgi:hypothetical protein